MESTVAITGATNGIGLAVARAFADAGAFVAVCGRDADRVESTVADLRATGDGGAWGIRADVRDEFDVERFLEGTVREGGAIDVLLANAAVSHGEPGETPLDEASYAEFDDAIRTNARGVFATVTEALPHLADGARVIVPSGELAHTSRAGTGSYAVSKAAAEAIARGFAADTDYTVGVVDPGLVATDLSRKERARDPDSVAPFFVWAATEAPADELDGGRLGLRAWKEATR